ncbi:MAG: IscS subfamily cysteine desulfurase [Reyranella sp.]|nr:IscS subfamily cysteine desulfurase [Reyranella sp.]MBL6650483.1 IscS subfamily cysteine desulfurase [Reyranella sp.]
MNVHTQIRRNDQPIYLDYQATTPLDPRVLEAMMPYFTHQFGNPHSRSHSYGWEAEEGVEKARAQVAKLVGADEKEVIFTSGATESNNLAIRGVAEFYKDRKNHIVTTVTEHKCVLDTCRHLEQQGFEVTYLPVQKNGLIDLDALRAAITDKTVVVSIMAVNNEIGVIQPLAEIGKICREKKVFFHTDAAQAAGKIPLDVEAMNIDLMSISGHKIYGPKGIGALYVRRKPRVRLVPLIVGGGQERGFRSGTLPTPLCVGLGEAAEIAMNEMDEEAKRLTKLQQRMLKGLQDRLPEIFVNGDLEHRIPGNLNISFAYVEGESLMMGIKNLAVSSGSACTSASLEPSYVLRALGVDEELAHTSLRIGLGRFTTEHEVDTAVDELVRHVKKLREMSPLWEMAQEGIDIKSIEWAAH